MARRPSTASRMTSASRPSRRKPWSIAGPTLGSRERSADPPAGVRLERVRDAGRLVAPALRAAGDPRQEMPVPGPVRARAAPQPDEDLRLEEPVHVVLPHRVLEVGRRRPGDADTGMVDEPLADGKLVGDRLDAVPPELLGGADAAAQEDRGRRVCARADDDPLRFEQAAVAHDADGRAVLDHDPVDEGVGDDREVGPRTRGVEVRERGVPPRRPACVERERRGAVGRVEVVQVGEPRDPDARRALQEGTVPGRQLGVGEGARPELPLGPLQERLQLRIGPRAPLVVVVARAPDDRARVVCRAASDHARAARRATALVVPVVGGGERVRRAQVGRPRVAGRAVVGPRLHQADRPLPGPRRGALRRHSPPCRHRRRGRRSARGDATTASRR